MPKDIDRIDYAKQNGINPNANYSDLPVNVNGFDIIVRVKVVEGIIGISTAFIK